MGLSPSSRPTPSPPNVAGGTQVADVTAVNPEIEAAVQAALKCHAYRKRHSSRWGPSPQDLWIVDCEGCRKTFPAYRRSAKHCEPKCGRAHRERFSPRAQVLDRDRHRCVACGETSRRMFVRAPIGAPKTFESLRTLCATCHRRQSHRVFWDRTGVSEAERKRRAEARLRIVEERFLALRTRATR